MKIFKFILIFLGFMIVGFLLFMTFSGSEFSVTIKDSIHSSRSEVYTLLNDTSYFRKWKESITEIDFTKGKPGEKGSAYTLVYTPKEQGDSIAINFELVDVIPNEKMVYKVEAPRIFSETRTIELYDSADMVNISIIREVKAENWLVKFLLKSLEQSLPLETKAEIEGLKKLVADRGPSQI